MGVQKVTTNMSKSAYKLRHKRGFLPVVIVCKKYFRNDDDGLIYRNVITSANETESNNPPSEAAVVGRQSLVKLFEFC